MQPADAGPPPGRWRRLNRRLNDNPRLVGIAFLVIAAGWMVGVVVFGSLDKLPFGLTYVLVGLLSLGRETLRVKSNGELVVPKRVWGGRRFTRDEVEAYEVPQSVWDTGPGTVRLRTGERVQLPADRFRAIELAKAQGVRVEWMPSADTDRPSTNGHNGPGHTSG